MSVGPINTLADAQRLFTSVRAEAQNGGASPEQVRSEEVAAASKQFEAIIMRQMLDPVVEPMMRGPGSDGSSGGSGSGVYSYLLTDVLANSLSQGGGLGISKLLQTQLTSKGHATAAQAASVYSPGKVQKHE